MTGLSYVEQKILKIVERITLSDVPQGMLQVMRNVEDYIDNSGPDKKPLDWLLAKGFADQKQLKLLID